MTFSHRYRREIPDHRYHPVKWRCQPWSSSWGIQILADHTYENKGKQNVLMIVAHMRALVSRIVWLFMLGYLHAQITVDANDMHPMNQGYFDYGKNLNTQNRSPKQVNIMASKVFLATTYVVCTIVVPSAKAPKVSIALLCLRVERGVPFL